jgi:3-deoxy-D-manno-octulosonic acid kinase
MSVKTRQDGLTWVLYDDQLWPDHKALPKSFDFSRRLAKGGRALGSGRNAASALIWRRKDGREWVLRHYRRGGLIARLSPDRYVWLGLARSRAWREFHLLRALHAEGLPVPRPVAARVIREGLRYRQDLITERLPEARPLSEVLQAQALTAEAWAQLGEMLARFHRAGVGHADLNAANVLLDDSGRFFLIDFDRGRRPASPVFQARSLRRLRHSLDKWSGKVTPFHYREADWDVLRTAYAAASAARRS